MEITELIHELEDEYPHIAKRLKVARDKLVLSLYEKSDTLGETYYSDECLNCFFNGKRQALRETADSLRG